MADDYSCSAVGSGGTQISVGQSQFDVSGASDVISGGTRLYGGLWQFDIPACCGSTSGSKALTWYFNMRGLNISSDQVYWVSKDRPNVPPGLVVTEVTCLLMYSASS